MRRLTLCRVLVCLVSVWVLYAQHVALTHVLEHVRASAKHPLTVAPEPDRDAPSAPLCAFDATLCQLLFTAPGEDFGHPVLAAGPVAPLVSVLTHAAFTRLHPPSRGPPPIL